MQLEVQFSNRKQFIPNTAKIEFLRVASSFFTMFLHAFYSHFIYHFLPCKLMTSGITAGIDKT